MKIPAAGKKVRIQGVSTEQTVKTTAGTVHRVVLSNGGASARTLTLTDGASVVNVLNLPASVSLVLDIGARFTTSIKMTPSHADVDALVLYD